MISNRFYRLVLGGIGLGAALLQIAALGPLRDSFWGFHLAGFVPAGWRVVAVLVTAAAVGWLWWPRHDLVLPGAAWFERRDRTVLMILVLAATMAVAGWGWRSQQTVLGDALPLVTDLPRSAAVHPRQPLAMWLQQKWYGSTASTFAGAGRDATAVAARSVASHSIACGIVFVVLAVFLARALSRDLAAPGATTLGLALLFMTQGYAALFFGYLENYAIAAAGMALFLWCGVRAARGDWPLWAPLVAWTLSLGLHTSAIALLPAVAWLIVSALRRPRARRAAAWRDVVLGGVAVVLLDRLLAALGAPASLWGAVRHIVATALENQGGGAGVAYLFSARHLRDFFNAQYLIGPLAAFLFVPAAIQAARRRAWRDPVNAFVAIAAGTLLLGCWATAEPALGYARDWDLFAPAGVAFAAAGMRFAVQAQAPVARVRWLAAAVVLSVVHLGVWVAVNHSEPRAMARFATLPLGLGRTEVVIGNWHLRNGRPADAIPWFERALRVDPRNSNAWAFLGMIHADRNDLAAAAHAFERATAARPDKPLYRHNLVIALEKMERWSETLPHYEILCRIEPDYLPNWSGRAHAMARAGRAAEARALLQDWLARNASHPRRHDVAAWLRDLDGISTPP